MGQEQSAPTQELSKTPLLVLDLNGILLSRYHRVDGVLKQRSEPLINPLAEPFLRNAMKYWHIAIWTAAPPLEADAEVDRLKKLVPDLDPFFIWTRMEYV